jgi:lipid-A-disaccharide synthase-like uncharacterized protein
VVRGRLWHLQFFYSTGAVQSHMPMGLYALSAIASSVLFAWLFNRTEEVCCGCWCCTPP